jgi:hypothetical protein
MPVLAGNNAGVATYAARLIEIEAYLTHCNSSGADST